MALEYSEIPGLDEKEVSKVSKSVRFPKAGTSMNMVRRAGVHTEDLQDSSHPLYLYSYTRCSVRKLDEEIMCLDIYKILDIQI